MSSVHNIRNTCTSANYVAAVQRVKSSRASEKVHIKHQNKVFPDLQLGSFGESVPTLASGSVD